MPSHSAVVALFAATHALSLVDGASFLASRQRWGSREVSAEMVQEIIKHQLSSSDSVALAMQQELLPTFAALPKNHHGLLDPPTARYALHRYFAQKYGWYVRGLDPKGGSWNSTKSATISKDRLPQHVQSLFHKDRGLDLQGLAAFGRVLSKIMEDEVVAGLEEIFVALNLDTSEISDFDFDEVVKAYLARVILGASAKEHITPRVGIIFMIDEVSQIYSEWPNTVLWGRDSIRSFDWGERHVRNPFVQQPRNFDSAVRSVRSMMHRLNELNLAECATVKRELMEKEVDSSGRINLYDFYSDYKRKRESVDYLRNIGVLDESDPQRPKLLIANLIVSTSNCLVDASYYSSCCPNECENLMGHLERKLMSPEATPGQITDLVSHLGSDSVPAPRNLTATLLGKLSSIADMHSGKVPLHGRLFSQWMHHAYPRECPFPQVSGSFKPLTQDEFVDKHLVRSVFVAEHMMREQREKWRLALSDQKTGVEAPWDTVEELIAQHHSPELQRWSLGGLRSIAAVIAFGSMVLPLMRSTSKLMCGRVEEELKTHLV